MRWFTHFLAVTPLSALLFAPVAHADLFPCTTEGILDAIALGGGPHTFACAGPTTVTPAEMIEIDNDVILDGEGRLIIDGDNRHKVLFVPPVKIVELHNMTITRGLGNGPEGGTEAGAGILNSGILTLVNLSVLDNHLGAGGGVANRTLRGDPPPSLTIINSIIAENTGGGIFNDIDATLTVTGSVIAENTGSGIFNRGLMTVSDSTVSGNEATKGGGIFNEGSPWLAQFTITSTTISENLATSEGGGLYNIGSLSGGQYAISNSTISGNTSVLGGGGIRDFFGQVEIVSSTISGNTAR